jgi:recombination protein RecT
MTMNARHPAKTLQDFLAPRLAKMGPSAVNKTLTPDRLMRVALVAASRNPKLLECSPESVYHALVRAQQLGLEPETAHQHAYLIPRWNSKARRMECVFQTGYMGLIHLAIREQAARAIWAEVVYEGEPFEAPAGYNPEIKHTRKLECIGGNLVGVYAVAVLPSGEKKDALLSRLQVEQVRDRVFGEGKASGPWQTDFAEMAKKTAIRRLFKTLGVGPGQVDDDDIEESDAATVEEPVAEEAPRRSARAAAVASIAARAAEPALPEASSIGSIVEAELEPEQVR